MNGGPQRRVSSPSGLSTLMTSAPRSASVWPIKGPARMRASSTTRRPASALVRRVESRELASLALPPPLWGRGGVGGGAAGGKAGGGPPPTGCVWRDPPPLSSPTRGEDTIDRLVALMRHASKERLQARLRASQDQRVNVVRALVGVHGLEVREVAHDLVFDLDAVAAVHVARGSRDVERLSAVVALDHRDHFRRRPAFVHEPPDPERGLEPERDLGLHVGELLLEELGRRERPAELLAVEAVLAGAEPAILRRAHCAPGYAVASAIEAAERPLESRDVRQERAIGRLDIVEHDLAGDRGAQGKLAPELRRGEALHALLEDEAANLIIVRARLRPDDEYVGDRGVADPGLGADEAVAAVDLLGSSGHAAGIGAGVRLGEPEAADELAEREARQVLQPLVGVAIGVDGIHDERTLHAHHRAEAGVDALDLTRHQSVSDITRAGAAEFRRQRHSVQPRFAHHAKQLGVGLLLEIGLLDPGRELFGGEVPRRVADHALVLGELSLEQQRIVPLERAEIGSVKTTHRKDRKS